jgi:hypothetical protein
VALLFGFALEQHDSLNSELRIQNKVLLAERSVALFIYTLDIRSVQLQ